MRFGWRCNFVKTVSMNFMGGSVEGRVIRVEK
jgi:hypothetical protein